ncbi:MAG: septum formation protein Maf [Prevotella sp.]|nr:septum formation protein Maf [Prevotella sp.]MBO5205398.1 septum formation protein Maf [Prevotella sp.]
MLDNLKKYNIILASGSPRRKQLLEGLGIEFSQHVLRNIDESFPDTLLAEEVAQFIAHKKSEAYLKDMADNDLVITADTIVVADDGCGNNVILGKPHDRSEAVAMLRMLSNKTHKVITGCCIVTKDRQRVFSVSTEVTFKQLSDEEIEYYVDTFRPYDKAGAYGVQEWIGYIGVTGLSGSYFNVMGFPIQRVYTELAEF